MNFWYNYIPEDLEKLIKEKPLTKEDIIYTLQNKIEKIKFLVDLEWKQSAMASWVMLHNNQYLIFINLQKTLEEQEASLVHEICHVYYNAGGIGWSTPRFGPERNKGEKIEGIIEKETQRFYEDNKNFVKELYAKLSK